MPIPNYNQDTTYWCDLHNCDIDPSVDFCKEVKQDETCYHCCHCNKQYYTMVIQDESQKEFISPSKKK